MTTTEKKYQAGLAVGRSDLQRNGREWLQRNAATLVTLNMDEPNWLRGYCDALNELLTAAQDEQEVDRG